MHSRNISFMTSQQLFLLALGVVFALLVLRPLLFGGPRISPADAAAKVKSGEAVLIDVREPSEWTSGVAKPAALLPISDLHGHRKQWTGFLQKNRGKTLILYCASGMRSGSAAAKLKKEGFTVFNLGGFSRWTGAGLPIRRP
jgi:rhodanese-related sulfurtransferase